MNGNMRRFLIILLTAAIFFIAGFVVGRFVMPRQVYITVVDINKLVDIIERYNEAKYEFERIREWNEEAMVAPQEEEKGTEEPRK